MSLSVCPISTSLSKRTQDSDFLLRLVINLSHLYSLLKSGFLGVREPGPGLQPHGVSVEDDQLRLRAPRPGPGTHQSDLNVPDTTKATRAFNKLFYAPSETLDGGV